MNLFDVWTTSPHYVYRKCLGAANENWNVDLAISNDLPWGRCRYLSPLTQKRTQMDIHFSEITFSVCSFHNIITAFLIPGLLWRNIEWNPRQIPEVQCTCSQLHMEIQWKEPGHEQDTWGEWSLGWEWRVLQVEHEWRTLPTGYSFVL